ncbi:MAG: hypoxanthine phosphoribosyltransferase [Saprospiraceae bacterium]|jgi:hypoxanthine phosphoribosyltransferase|nr:hypoxanthine phosphoribosyltransferase [Saprospiraceae bacterium]
MVAALEDKEIALGDLHFVPFISEREILDRVSEIGAQINLWNLGDNPLVISVLNGAFVFTADVVRELAFTCEIAFIQLNSYDGTRSKGEIVMEGAQLGVPVKGRDIIIMEDIVDSGLTMFYLVKELQKRKPASIRIVTLLHKPEMQEFPLSLDAIGFSIPPEFVVGYGLDYRGLGRNLRSIYKVLPQPEVMG